MCGFRKVFYGLFNTIFEILEVLAICRDNKIQNWARFGKATAKIVKYVKNHFSFFQKMHLLNLDR